MDVTLTQQGEESEEEGQVAKEHLKKKSRYGKRQWKVIVIIGITEIFINAIYTLQAPFYPREAEHKGATATQFGCVFGMYEIAMFLWSPLCGNLLGYVRPKSMYIIGLLSISISTICFGFLDWSYDRTTFIGLSILFRVIEGAGTAAVFSATFSIIATEFPDKFATTFGMLESCVGVGLIIGPSIGGILFDVGGFVLPFLSVGLILFLMCIMAFIFLPEPNNSTSLDQMSPDGGFIQFVKVPAIFLDALCILFASSSIGFIDASLEPHLRKNFGFSVFTTGMIFLFDAVVYAITAPIWGAICDGGTPPKVVTLAGCLMIFFSVIFIGPPSGIYHTTLWMVCVGLILHGAGAAAALNSASAQVTLNALASGYPDNVSTYGLVGSLWVASYSLGCFIGPSVGGVLLDHFGFRKSILFVLINQFIIAIVLVISIKITPAASMDPPPQGDDNHVVPGNGIN